MREHVTMGAVGRRTGISLVISCVVPALIFLTCYERFGVHAAMGAALVWAYGALAVRVLTGQRVCGMLVVTCVILTARTGIAVLAHSSYLYFIQPALSDGVLGAAFLISLLAGRPLTARLAGDFYPMNDAASACPGMQTLFRRLAGFWAVYLLGKSVLIVWLLEQVSIDGYVRTMSVVNPTLNLLAATLTITVSTAVLRREGLIGRAPALEPAAIAA